MQISHLVRKLVRDSRVRSEYTTFLRKFKRSSDSFKIPLPLNYFVASARDSQKRERNIDMHVGTRLTKPGHLDTGQIFQVASATIVINVEQEAANLERVTKHFLTSIASHC